MTARAVATGRATSVSGGFTTELAETPRIAAGADGGYIVRVPANESALFVKIGVSEKYVAPGTVEGSVTDPFYAARFLPRLCERERPNRA